MRELMFSLFDGAKNAAWEPCCESWADLRWRLLCAPVQPPGVDKLALPAWSPAIFEGDRRSKAGAISLDLLVLDYDDGTPIADAVSRWCRWPGLLHTSWSHTPEVPKFRVVLPLRSPIPAAGWAQAWSWAAQHSGRSIDPACKDPSRIYFASAIPAGGESTFYATSWGMGRPWLRIPWEQVALPKPKAVKPWRPLPGHYPPAECDAARAALLRLPEKRLALGAALGGQVRGERVTRARCPSCSRRSVWWIVEPDRWWGAKCDHQNSCGWAGPLREVAHVA